MVGSINRSKLLRAGGGGASASGEAGATSRAHGTTDDVAWMTWLDVVDPDQQRKAYYYTDPPPTTFDEEGTVWLKKYWHRVAKDRQPRDRAQEKRMREMKKRATTAQGGLDDGG